MIVKSNAQKISDLNIKPYVLMEACYEFNGEIIDGTAEYNVWLGVSVQLRQSFNNAGSPAMNEIYGA